MVQLASYYRGCLLGGDVGDALGAPAEIMPTRETQSRYGEEVIRDFDRAFGRAGLITDDAQMTLLLQQSRNCPYAAVEGSGVYCRTVCMEESL